MPGGGTAPVGAAPPRGDTGAARSAAELAGSGVATDPTPRFVPCYSRARRVSPLSAFQSGVSGPRSCEVLAGDRSGTDPAC